jgi:hypothetical protein
MARPAGPRPRAASNTGGSGTILPLNIPVEGDFGGQGRPAHLVRRRAAVVVLILLAWLFGWFGAAEAPTPPPAITL